MGMFPTSTHADHRWLAEEDPIQRDGAPSGPSVSATVHDSGFATLRYEPAAPAGCLAYLGFQPRDYFDDPSASDDEALSRELLGKGRRACSAEVVLTPERPRDGAHTPAPSRTVDSHCASGPDTSGADSNDPSEDVAVVRPTVGQRGHAVLLAIPGSRLRLTSSCRADEVHRHLVDPGDDATEVASGGPFLRTALVLVGVALQRDVPRDRQDEVDPRLVGLVGRPGDLLADGDVETVLLDLPLGQPDVSFAIRSLRDRVSGLHGPRFCWETSRQ